MIRFICNQFKHNFLAKPLLKTKVDSNVVDSLPASPLKQIKTLLERKL